MPSTWYMINKVGSGGNGGGGGGGDDGGITEISIQLPSDDLWNILNLSVTYKLINSN